jgi:hypothetical protein
MIGLWRLRVLPAVRSAWHPARASRTHRVWGTRVAPSSGDPGLPRTGPAGRCLVARYAVTWLYLAGSVIAGLAFAALPSRDQAAVLGWASTNVANLRHDPVGSLVASAFVQPVFAVAWLALIALAVFGANQVLGNWRTALVCGTGHVLGTLVSEGVVAFRIAHGLLPASDAHILDVGPSYIVVSALTVVVMYGSWPARVAAAFGFAVLVFGGDIFSGLSTLRVAAVGHTVAITSSALIGSVLAWQVRRSRRLRRDGLPPVPPSGVAAPQAHGG